MKETYVCPLFSYLLCAIDSLQDDVLAEAITKADAEVEKIKQEADAKKWRMVAHRMKIMKVRPVRTWIHRIC